MNKLRPKFLYFIFIPINDFPNISYEFTKILFYEVKERCGKQEWVKETKRGTQEWGVEWSERESKGWSSTRENCYNVPQYGVVSCELAPRQWKFSGLKERHRPKCILSGPWSVLYRWLPIRHFHSPKSSCSRFFSSSTSFCYGFERNVGSRTTISYVLKQRNYSERIFSLRVMTILRKLKRMLWHWCYVKADAVCNTSICFAAWIAVFRSLTLVPGFWRFRLSLYRA